MQTPDRTTCTAREHHESRAMLDAIASARAGSTAYAYGAQLLLYCCRYPLHGVYDLTADDLDHALNAGRAAEARSGEMDARARERLHHMTIRIAQELQARRDADAAAQAPALTGEGTYPKGAAGTRPVKPTGPTPTQPPNGQYATTIATPAPAALYAPTLAPAAQTPAKAPEWEF